MSSEFSSFSLGLGESREGTWQSGVWRRYHWIQGQNMSYPPSPPATDVQGTIPQQSRCCWQLGSLVMELLPLNKAHI